MDLGLRGGSEVGHLPGVCKFLGLIPNTKDKVDPRTGEMSGGGDVDRSGDRVWEGLTWPLGARARQRQ